MKSTGLHPSVTGFRLETVLQQLGTQHQLKVARRFADGKSKVVSKAEAARIIGEAATAHGLDIDLAPIADGGDGTMAGGKWPKAACNAWGGSLNGSRNNFGVTIAGEFSNAINDCGLYIRGTTAQPSTSAPCPDYNDWQNWNATMKDGFKNFMLASMDALGDWFFWTWKIGNSSTTNTVRAPLWSYSLGLAQGWMPADPRTASGKCQSLDANMAPFDGTFESWMTGGAGAGTIAPAATQGLAWPPAEFTDVPQASMAGLPQYTATGTVSTLPPPSFSASATASVGNGWFDAGDNAPAVTPIAGCAYPDAWDAEDAQIPVSGCLPARR